MSNTQNAYWRDHLDDLRARAVDVMTSPTVATAKLSAAQAASCLGGVVSYIDRRAGIDAAQRAAAALARHEDAWSSSFGSLPHVNGVVSEHVVLLAVVCRGLLTCAGAVNLRSALSFWACEDDPAVWSRLFA